MGSTSRASVTRVYSRICAVPVIAGMAAVTAFSNGATALAEPGSPDSVAGLVAAVATADQKLQDLGAAVQTQQESFNKALVELQSARDAATAAAREVDASRQGVEDASAAIVAAQKRFDTFAAATYVSGPSDSYLTASDPADIVAAASAGQTLATSAQHVMTNLQRARTEQVNKESAARLAKQRADQAVVDAQASQDAAVAALEESQRTFAAQQTQLDRLVAERAEAKARLEQVRPVSAPLTKQAATAPQPAPQPGVNAAGNWDHDAAAAAKSNSQWDLTIPAIPSAFVSGDPIAIINAVLQIAYTSLQVTADLGRKFLQKLGLAPTPTGLTNGGPYNGAVIPNLHGQRASEYVIQRAMAQRGVPYSWGGGNAAGPSRGIDSGAGTVGFDCSGLVLYAFAGVGLKLPHYSGSQYEMGRKIPTSQMRRGDVLFWGPGGSQHVAIFLGNGQMIEAPYTGSHVKISPVRTSGMTPYAVRYIEY